MERRSKPADLERRLLDGVHRSASGCWEWVRCKDRKGYGKIGTGHRGRPETAHRVSYSLFCAPIPPGTCVLHRCDNPSCVRPDHLFLGTVADNNRDMLVKGRCARGDRSGPRQHPERYRRGSTIPWSKLTEADVVAIRKAVAAGVQQSVLAARYGVSRSTMCNLVAGKIWGHV